jgi:eukaryotic-like serine/threonine-protein kinase
MLGRWGEISRGAKREAKRERLGRPMRSADETQRAVTVPPEVDDLASTLELPVASARPRYDVIGPIGEGGMGSVLLSRDRIIGRQVAWKVMRPGQSTRQDLRRRFLREALVQGQLEHPSIVPVYDVMAAADGSPCFTMKRVRGVTLEEVIDGLRGEDPEVVRSYTRHKLLTAFGSVCLAIELAHYRGVLHRDLKPANIMLGDFGEVYVLDWGVAKLAGDAEEAVAATNPDAADIHTQLGQVMGTPGYMAPERLTKGAPVDVRADVYSLGAILFEVLARDPLHIPGVTASTLDASSRKGTDARPSLRARHLDIPPELDAICVKATALSADDRYDSCRALYDDLSRFLEGDRDLERRKEMAAELALTTRSALTTGAHRTDAGARGDAIRDLGRALALDPSSTSAADALVGLLTAPPEALPAEAEAALFAQNRKLSRVRTRTACIAFLIWLVVLYPFGLWSGVHRWAPLAATTVAFLVAAGALFGASRNPPEDGSSSPYLVILAALAVVSTYPIFGPLVGLPGMAAVVALGFTIAARRTSRFLPLVLSLLAMVVPLGFEVAGVLPSSYEFKDGMMCIVPHAVLLQKVPTYLLFVAVNGVLIAMGAYFALTLSRALASAHRRMHLQAWQLRQLLPREAQHAGPPSLTVSLKRR